MIIPENNSKRTSPLPFSFFRKDIRSARINAELEMEESQ